MRRFIPLLMIVSAISAVILGSHLRERPISNPQPPAPQVTEQATPAALKEIPPRQEQILAKAYATTPSLRSMENQYLGIGEEELQGEFEKSKERLSELNAQQADLVLTEIRRQHVLSNLLAKRKIESLRRAL